MVCLTVIPKSSLADSPVSIRASGLHPSQLVTLHALLTDDKGEKFESRAFFQANLSGEVDVKQAPALGGDYTGVWSMGLFCSLKPEKLFYRLMKRDVMGSPFHVQISLFDSVVPLPKEAPLATCTVERWYAAPGVERFHIKTGRVRGALFLPPGPGPFPGVIDLFGGSGGLIEFRASLLASKGFAVLALAFFAYDDLPQTLIEVDLEYFEEASILLLKHPKVRGPGLGVIGLSKGAEIALAMSIFLQHIVAVVCINGATALIGIPLRFHDIYIPAVPYPAAKTLITKMGAIATLYVLDVPQDEKHQVSAIPAEKARGHVLFVVGENDQSINSKSFAEMSIARAKKYGKNNVTLLSYPGAGHLMEPPGSPLCYSSTIRGSSLAMLWGGETEPHTKAQEHSWKEIQKFLELHLGPVGKSNL
ncbi:acyl-coenzyme A amino acid N-acyltransferase 2-like [Rhineura floridana]|uniref:acyl-coenzyme A amino acid N-acyltransferase 2-like n=1 Tax=Rhineura floridana TaxID=261503 RepID=UPI002AC84F4B|nr:acyl-coenzyme A amino acid N-acyltransferase 2-like [Rhineura floridana]XP_061465747.1 acyl-coenzyme A amino acid N-acyltransferase 2-like [Rhineura floridana]XP_061465748.1 acyl-coenzyme A amino acid N-acyltransferase 2-like [Rhineura floridana]XP_061465749.1 acyl-coenzyme A amino acid N-acyltransferase 2-like [Rhineura floridana]